MAMFRTVVVVDPYPKTRKWRTPAGGAIFFCQSTLLPAVLGSSSSCVIQADLDVTKRAGTRNRRVFKMNPAEPIERVQDRRRTEQRAQCPGAEAANKTLCAAHEGQRAAEQAVQVASSTSSTSWYSLSAR